MMHWKLWIWLAGIMIIALCLVGISPLAALIGLSGQSQVGHCIVVAKRLQYIAKELEYHASWAPGAAGYYMLAPENYVPIFTVVLAAANGHFVESGRYDPLEVNRTQSEAQAILERYRVGKSYPCRYMPGSPSQVWLSTEGMNNAYIPLIFVILIMVGLLELGLMVSLLKEARVRRQQDR